MTDGLDGSWSERTGFHPSRIVPVSPNERGMKNSKSRWSKLGNLRMAQIAAPLWALDEYCERGSTRKRHAEALIRVKSYAEGCGVLRRADDRIVSFFEFLWRLVDIYTPKRA